MQKTEQKTKPVEQSEGLMDLNERYQAIKSKEIVEATKVVELRYSSCCGCGCDEYVVRRVVPFDSPLKDGDPTDIVNDGEEYKVDGENTWETW